MTVLDDHEIDRRLRRAGERLRAEAPSALDVEAAWGRLATRSVAGARRRSRWVVPTVIGAVAAAVVGLVVVTSSDDVTAPPAPVATAPPLITLPPPVVTTFAEDFDGDGGECYELAGVRGCATGGQVRSGRPLAVWSGHGPTTASGDPLDASCAQFVAGWLDVVECGQWSLIGVLPTTATGQTQWILRDRIGGEQRLELIPSTDGALVFEVPGSSPESCVVAASASGGDWVEACLPGGTGLAWLDDGPVVVDAATGTVAIAQDPGCEDLEELLREAGTSGGVTERLSCAGDLAIAVQGPAPIRSERNDALGLLLERDGDRWRVIDEGPTLPCAPVAFCEAFGPADDLVTVAEPVEPP